MYLSGGFSDDDFEFPVEGGDHEGNDNPLWQQPVEEPDDA